MILCTSLFRVDRLRTLTSTQALWAPGRYASHGLSFRAKVGGRELMERAGMQTKRQKTSIPVCTQASSSEDCLEADTKVESEDRGQIQEVQCHTSTTVIGTMDATTMTEVVNKVTELTVGSTALQDDGEDIALEGKPAPSSGKHSLSIEVGTSLMRFIRGKGGSVQQRIEEEMGVTIIFPSSKEEESVVIEGMAKDNVTRASEKIQAIIDETVKGPSLDYSHFVSLPLAIHPELVEKLIKFQKSILGEVQDVNSNEETAESEADDNADVAVELKVDCDKEGVKENATTTARVSYPPKATKSSTISDLGIEKSIFIKPKTFHLTVLMLKLWNKNRVQAATKILQDISSKVMDALENRPIFVRLKGLDCMRGSLAKAQVVYAPVEVIDDEARLLRACHVIIDAFVEAGLVMEKDAKQRLKLHATVMNARHRKRRNRSRRADPFDARGIFEQYGSEEWGEYHIREAHLSQRFVFDENGYYHCCASIPFPEAMRVD